MAPDALKPFQNAENIAAAATGKHCLKSSPLLQQVANIILRELVHQEVWLLGH